MTTTAGVRRLLAAGTAATVTGLTLGVAPAAMADGNNGTVKIDGEDIESAPDNDPHVGCVFNVDWFNFDENATSQVTFELQAPTTGGTLGVNGPTTVDLEDDPADGAGNDHDGSQTYTLSFDGVEPHPNQGYHVKLTIATNDSNGSDTKTKVFWVEGCDEPEEPTPSEPTEPTPSEPTEPTPSEPTEPTPSEPTEPTPSEPTEPTDEPSTPTGEPSTPDDTTPPAPNPETPTVGGGGTPATPAPAPVPTHVDAGLAGDSPSPLIPLGITGAGLLVLAAGLLARRRAAVR